MGQRHILLANCNCFYASVEMQEHPELRGKSIAVAVTRGTARYVSHRKLSRQADGRENGNAHLGGKAALP